MNADDCMQTSLHRCLHTDLQYTLNGPTTDLSPQLIALLMLQMQHMSLMDNLESRSQARQFRKAIQGTMGYDVTSFYRNIMDSMFTIFKNSPFGIKK